MPETKYAEDNTDVCIHVSDNRLIFDSNLTTHLPPGYPKQIAARIDLNGKIIT